MDRTTVWAGAIPQDTDLLTTNKNAMIGLAKLSKAMLGTTGIASGLAVAPTSPASLFVNVGIGELYMLENVDNTAYGSLAADTTDTIVKQGIQLGTVVLPCPAPTTAGFSINYLIEATYQDADINNTVLPYYNASNPSQAFSGPGNSGNPSSTTRAGQVFLQVKAGIAATTGTQATPTTDAGYVPLAVVTVANGQTTITTSSITAITSNVLPGSLLATVQGNLSTYAVDTGAVNAYVAAYQPAPATLVDGMTLYFQAAHANTGASTLNVNGLGAKPIIGGAHVALQGGEIISGGKVEVVWHAGLSSFILLEQTGGGVQVPNATNSQQAMPLGQATGRLLGITVIAATGTFTPNPLATRTKVRGAGGGAAGGGTVATSSSTTSVGSGGNSGAYAEIMIPAPIGAPVSVTVGAGGSGVSGASGNVGGSSAFGSFLTLPGGLGGLASTATPPPFLGFSNTTGALPTVSGGAQTILAMAGEIGTGAFGLALTAAANSGGRGGRNPIGAQTAGGFGFGGGGGAQGASSSATAGGAGTAGGFIVEEYA